MKIPRSIIILVLLVTFVTGQDGRAVGNIRTERKIALVIGNTDYDASVGRLTNPANDARDVAGALQRLGFTLVGGKAQLDVNKKRMLALIREFGQEIKRGAIGFFYFSGHGVQVSKENYIIPITDSLVYEDDAATEAVNVDTIAKEMQYAENRLNILVLDACRNNRLLKRDKNTEGGLTKPRLTPQGTFIAFAADDGQTASDNVGARNGLFTQELLKNLETPNARLDDIFRVTRKQVERLSNGKQQPMFVDRTNEAFTLNSNVTATASPQSGNSSYVVEAQVSASTQAQTQVQTSGGTQSQTQSQIINGTQSQTQSQTQSPVPGGTQSQTQSQSAQPQLNNNLPGYPSENLAIKEVTISYETEKTYRIGSGPREFITRWSSCSNNCVFAYSDNLDSLANSKAIDFASIGDFTAHDRSSRVRRMQLSQILILRNKNGYFALAQIAAISHGDKEVTIRYKIIPDRRDSTWQAHPEKYVSTNLSGRIRFIYEDNNGDFVIGEADRKFALQFGRLGQRKVRLYNDDGISLVAVVTDPSERLDAKKVNNYLDQSGKIVKDGRIAELEIGDRVIISNKKGSRAVVKIVEAKSSGYSSDVDEVTFEYWIFSDSKNFSSI